MATVLAFPPEVELALAARTMLAAQDRARFHEALRDCGRDEAPFSVERLQALMAVEEHLQALILYDQIEFLRRPPPVSEPDREFAIAVQRLFVEAANGLQRFLRHRADWAHAEDAREMALRATGLALHAIHGFMKWGYFLDEPARPAPWKQVHTLYLLADHEGLAQTPFVLHPSQPSFKPTVLSLYLRILVLELLNTGSLSRIQVEIADGWLASWCGDYSLDAAYAPRLHLFCVDVASASGMRLVRADTHGASTRYLRADALRAQIEEVRAGLRHGRLHAGHGAGSVFPVEQHVALLAVIEKLYQAILAGGGSRLEERQHFEDREVDAVLGIETLLRAAAAPGAAAADEAERWRVHDLSASGYGLLAERRAAERAILNGLVGLRNQDTGGWIVGTVVRKLPDRSRGETLLGIEVLSHKPIPVELAAEGSAATVAALFLPGRDANGKLDALLVRAGDFDSTNAWILRAAAAEYRVRMNRIIRKGADWIKARFEIVAKKA